MAIEDLFSLVDAILPGSDDSNADADEETTLKFTYNSLYDRMSLVVKVLIREKRKEDATRCIIAFFKDFKDLDVLEKTVIMAETLITQSNEGEMLEEI